MWIVLQHRLAADLDQRLRDQGRGVQAVLDRLRPGSSEPKIREEVGEFARGLPVHGMLQLRDDSGHAIFSQPAERRFEFSTLSDYQTISDGKQRFRLLNLSLTHEGRQYSATVGASMEDVETIMHSFRNL